jgi:hypothetical protein
MNIKIAFAVLGGLLLLSNANVRASDGCCYDVRMDCNDGSCCESLCQSRGDKNGFVGLCSWTGYTFHQEGDYCVCADNVGATACEVMG